MNSFGPMGLAFGSCVSLSQMLGPPQAVPILLMVEDGVNVTGAAYRVGYESVSLFSREYTRMFGVSPKRNIADLHAVSV